jgi:hypothetical protein
MKVSRAPGNIDKIGSFASIAANITVVVSLVIALLTYFNQKKQDQRDVVRALASDFNSGPVLDAQLSLAREIARLPTDALRNHVLERDTIATMLRQVEATSEDPIGFEQNAVLIVSFFDDAQACVDSESCSEDDMSRRLGDASIRYACLLLPYIAAVREYRLYSGLGDGLAKMARYDDNC